MSAPSSEAMERLSVVLSGSNHLSPVLLRFTRQELEASVLATSSGQFQWLAATMDALFDKTPASKVRQTAAFGRRPMRGKRRAAWLPVAPALREDMQIPGRDSELSFGEWLQQFLNEQSKGVDGVDTLRTLEWWLPSINTNMALPLLQEKLRHQRRGGRGGRHSARDPTPAEDEESAKGLDVTFSVSQLKRMLKTGGVIEPLKDDDDDEQEGKGKEEVIIKVFESVEEAQAEWNKYGQAFVDAAQEAELDIAKLHASIWQPLQGKVDELLSNAAWIAKLNDAEAACNAGLASLPPLDASGLKQRLDEATTTVDLDWGKAESVAVLEEAKTHTLANMAKLQGVIQQLNDACISVADSSHQSCADTAAEIAAASEAVANETRAAFPPPEEDGQEHDVRSMGANLPTIEQQKEQGVEKLKEMLAVADAKAAKALARKMRFVEARTAGLCDAVRACGEIESLVTLCNDNETDNGVAKGLEIFTACAGTELSAKMLGDLGDDQRSMCESAMRQMAVWLLKTLGKYESVASGFVSRKFADNVANVLAGLTAVRRGYRTKLVEIGVTPIIQTVLSQVSERVADAPGELLNYSPAAAAEEAEGSAMGEMSMASLKAILAQRNDENSQLKRALVNAEKELELQRNQQTQIITAFAKLHGGGGGYEEVDVDDMAASSYAGSARGGDRGRRNGRNTAGRTAATKRMADSVEMASRARLESLARARAILGEGSLEHMKTNASNHNARGNGSGRRGGRGGGRRSTGRGGPRRNSGAGG